ncbi:NAD-dependent epimerase/dehydratase family protein [Microbispora sp. H10949]|uniref:NAD-dependent epimerase/dehydratase family protein n=1 Tax=Microbispora sp. H10949 TaxID=2729111 RepID=UPI0016003655|nr:NAD(P)-dependent oxidoreductase [Microbispora sp. H10949]
MRVLVTGACGFVMSVFIRCFLQDHEEARVLALDVGEPDEAWSGHLADVAGRVDFVRCDVRDRARLTTLFARHRPETVVHGATVTLVPEWEREDPVRFLDVNVMGTAAVLDAARRAGSVGRVVHVSSAAVYGAGDPGRTEPQDEDTPLEPDEMYGVSKVAAELVARRFAALYGMSVPIVRCTKVFGPMERPTSARTLMSLPYHLARALVAGTPLAVTPRTLRAAGDWISAVDVAAALGLLCTRPDVGSAAFNLAGGAAVPVPRLAELFGVELAAGPAADPERAVVDADPALRSGKDGTYSVLRAARRLGWRPRDLPRQVGEYREWALAHWTPEDPVPLGSPGAAT